MNHIMQTSQTNGGRVVPVCTCGWIGSVHIAPVELRGPTKKRRRSYEAAEGAARSEHQAHMRTPA